jgi:hypothetical protein
MWYGFLDGQGRVLDVRQEPEDPEPPPQPPGPALAEEGTTYATLKGVELVARDAWSRTGSRSSAIGLSVASVTTVPRRREPEARPFLEAQRRSDWRRHRRRHGGQLGPHQARRWLLTRVPIPSTAMSDTTQTPPRGRVRVEPGAKRVRPSWAARPSSTPSTPHWCGRSRTIPGRTTCPGPTCAPSWSRPAPSEHSPSRVRRGALRRARRRSGREGAALATRSRPSPSCATSSGSSGRDGRVAGGGRAGVRPSAEPRTRASTSWPAPAACSLGRRGRAGRLLPSPHPLRDRLPPRYYLPLADLRTELLVRRTARPSALQGHGVVLVDAGRGQRYDDFVWIYRSPLPESAKITGWLLLQREGRPGIDGGPRARPTHFS